MVRRPTRANPQRPRRAAPQNSEPPSGTDREKIVAAFLALLAEERFERVGFADIAARAGVSLMTMRDEFRSKLGIIAAYMKEIDRKVLAEGASDLAEEPARERLFDVLMRRIEALAPRREAIGSLLHAARSYPGLAFALNGLAVNSAQWMLAAANIPASGPKGMVRAQGLALLYARVLRTFVHDDDPGLARTMAALDRALARGQRLVGILDDVCLFAPHRLLRRRRYHWRYRDDDSDYSEERAVV